MKVTVTHSKDDKDRQSMTVEVNNQVVFEVSEGEPEDRTLLRDFKDCAKVPALMMQFHAAGRAGINVDLKVVGTPEDPVPG